MGLIQNWTEHCKPPPSRSHASFPEWASTIGGITECAGYHFPIEAPKIDGAADTIGQDMRSLSEGIASGATLRSVDFEELTTIAKTRGLFEHLLGDLDNSNRAKLGSILKSYNGRLVAGYRFSLVGKGHGRQFQVEVVDK